MILTFFINNTILISIFIWFCSRIYPRKNINNIIAILFIILLMLFKSYINTYQISSINVLLTAIIYFLIFRLFFKGEFFGELIFSFVFVISSFVVEICTQIVMDALLNFIPFISNEYIYLVTGMTISSILLLGIAYIITKYNYIKGTIDASYIWYLSVIPITSTIVIYSILKLNLVKDIPILSFVITSGLLLSNFNIFKIFLDVINTKNIQLDNERLRNKELLSEMQNKIVEEKIENSKHFIHDFNKHIGIISSYTTNKEYDKLEEYLEDLNIDMQINTVNYITGNKIIDYTVNSKYEDIQKYKINLKYDIKVKDIPNISDKDFNLLFSNILENAIESCMTSTNKLIKIKLNIINNLLILKVINSCDYINDDYSTLKENKTKHGYGLKIIKKITSKYNGQYKFNYDKETHIFETIIFIPTLKED